MKAKDLSGMKFGRLTALLYDGKKTASGKRKWLCRCACGELLYVTVGDLGKTKSCGCLKIANNKSRSKHSMKKARIYNEWCGMKARCNNPKATHYKYYGGRGIKVCREWENDFLSFYKWATENGYSDTLTLDRIDTNKDYGPQNCRWVSMKTQNRNKRSNHYLSFNGKTQIISDWANELGISYKALSARLKRGWNVEEILTTPKLKTGQKIHKPTKGEN